MDHSEFKKLVRNHGSALVIGPYVFTGRTATAICMAFGSGIVIVPILLSLLIIKLVFV